MVSKLVTKRKEEISALPVFKIVVAVRIVVILLHLAIGTVFPAQIMVGTISEAVAHDASVDCLVNVGGVDKN